LRSLVPFVIRLHGEARADPATPSSPAPREVAVPFVRRHDAFSPTWLQLLWSLAIVGLLMFPCDFRAGAEFAHPHSLLQLLLDAADGTIDHHHADDLDAAHRQAVDWLDPVVGVALATAHTDRHAQPDVGDQQQSAPSISALPLLLAGVALLPPLAGGAMPAPAPVRRLAGRMPRVLVPPPR
jgi:hypothetical protein